MLSVLLCFSVMSLAPLAVEAKTGLGADRLENCNWNRPGVNPFMGDVVAAVDRYTEIPAAVRERLKQRMRDRNFDEFVTISRDAISGRHDYDARISDMHFGEGRVCKQVSRAGWNAQMKERGLVYCEQDHCILVPTVCRNVSRITRKPQAPGTAGAGAAGGAPANYAAAALPGTVPSTPSTPYEELRPGSLHGDVPAIGSSPEALLSPGLTQGPGFLASGLASSAAILSGSPGGSGRAKSQGLVVPLTPVPEPETWGMLLAGMAVLAVAARRRRA
ncbi:MHFG family PEP-CTERM protein [Janthinobacterium fluminis]|uniref:MHFG family PEP-CTERM protein n=1 Tax=Janthinobacterium fluminis TaxID=2987524 RepID=A0ABT5K2Z2_9BURK|nr:MHFG family PEP-CTERM protein [Janthinobacterium fluminis]MDC8759352.1 MHFG family PEP-CTERM protein [Janthinobacterium fluminis]